jgi:hypothetical protein
VVAVSSLALAGPALAAEPPTVTNIIPRNGSHLGGNTVTILGTNFTGATAVKFGTANAASFTVNSSTMITAGSPPGAEGTSVQVTVTTPEGTGGTKAPNEFFYYKSCQENLPQPIVSSVEPHSGRAETRVTIKGFQFFQGSCTGGNGVERVFFGLTEALHFEVVKPETELVAVAPPGVGTFDVRVENRLGYSAVTEGDQFTTLPGPTYHWYQNGGPMTAGESVPIVMFGGETNLSVSNGNCRTVGGGTVENPVGGAAGVGRTNSLAFYECKAPACEAEVRAKTGLEGRLTVTAENNPAATKEPAFPGWNDVLEESTLGGVFSVREKIGEPFVTFKTPSPPGMMRETDACIVAATGQVVAETVFEGELKPEIGPAKKGNLNGTTAGAPSQLKFNGEPYSGSLKYLGYNHQELITVKP